MSSGPQSPNPHQAGAIPKKFTAEFVERSMSVLYPDYSAAINCVISLSGRLDESRLARAVRLTLDAEPILGCRFVERWFRPHWRRYDNFDDVDFCEIRTSSDCDADMRQFVEAPPALSLRVLLLRGSSDLLCIKLDHRVGDGKAMLEYASVLAHVYNRLGDDPSFLPVPNVNGNRTMTQIGDRFGLREKWRIYRQISKTKSRFKSIGKWKYPVSLDAPLQSDYLLRKLDADRLGALWKYALAQRATVSQVLLAAFYLAAYDTLHHSGDRPLPMLITIDLRRYLLPKQELALCNLVGLSMMAVDPGSGNSLDAVVKQIRDQMYAQQKEYLGLAIGYFSIAALPVIRHIVGLVPFGGMKWFGRRAIRTTQRRREGFIKEGYFRGSVLLTYLGEMDPASIAFSGTETIDAFVTTGVIKIPGLLAMTATSFRGSLTLGLGFGSTAFVNRIFEHMMRILPASSPSSR